MGRKPNRRLANRSRVQLRGRNKTSHRRLRSFGVNPTPANCTVLGIDTASKSGFAIRVRGALITSGELDTTDRAAVLWVAARALRAAAESGTTLIAVLEAAYGGSRTVLLGLGAARERWISVFRELGIPKRRTISVFPLRWRSPLFGLPRATRREQWRAAELAAATAETKLATIGDDEAAAIGISRWAAHAPEVARLVKR